MYIVKYHIVSLFFSSIFFSRYAIDVSLASTLMRESIQMVLEGHIQT